MKRLPKILITAVLIFVVIFVGLSIFVYSQGKRIVVTKLQAVFDKPVEIGDIRLVLPLSLRVKDVHIGGMLRVKEVVMGLGFINFLNKEVNLSQVVLLEPQFVIHKSEPLPSDPGTIPQPTPSSDNTQATTQNPKDIAIDKTAQPRLFIDTLIIKNGQIHYLEHLIEQEDKAVVLRNVNLRASNVAYPFISTKTIFDIQATMGGDEALPTESRITGQGWVDALKKDMESKITIRDLDSKVLTAVFGGEDAFFKNAIVDLTVDLNANNNDLQVSCQVKVNELSFNSSGKGEDDSTSFEDILLQGLQKVGQGIEVNFRFKTKMDEFKIESIAFSGSVFQGSNGRGEEDSSEAAVPAIPLEAPQAVQ